MLRRRIDARGEGMHRPGSTRRRLQAFMEREWFGRLDHFPTPFPPPTVHFPTVSTHLHTNNATIRAIYFTLLSTCTMERTRAFTSL